MDILITCIAYLILSLSLAYYIFSEVSRKNRKKNGTLDACFEKLQFPFWVIAFLSDTLFTLGYYIGFFKDFYLESYLLIMIIPTCFSLLGLYFARWKIILQNDELIKCGLFKTTRIKITEVTKIVEVYFSKKIYVKGRKLFEVNARYHVFSRSFVNAIIEISNCEVIVFYFK